MGAEEMWPCGHWKTTENTQHVGKAGDRCRKCRQITTREYERRKHGYYERRRAKPGDPVCDACGSVEVQTHFDTWECSALCPVSQGEWPEYTKAAQHMMARTASLPTSGSGASE